MALTFPLTLAQFFDDLCISEASFDLDEAMQVNRTSGGEILTGATGTRLWYGEVMLHAHRKVDAEEISAKISVLRQAGRPFLVTPYGKAFPRLDPTGSILGVSAVTIQSVNANNRDITLQGLPVGYVLSAGDFLSFLYGSSPVRYALHQIAVGGTANGSGVATVEVSNFIRSGATAGIAVTLKNPVCKAVVRPGSFQPGSTRWRRWNTGMSFSFQQTLR